MGKPKPKASKPKAEPKRSAKLKRSALEEQLAAGLEVRMRPPGELKPHPQNPRVHSAAQIKEIAASILEFGWTDPIVVDEGGMILAGHGRTRAALDELGLARVPTVERRGLSEAAKLACVVAENQLALRSSWDFDMLKTIFDDLELAKFDVGVIAFDPGWLGSLDMTKVAGATDPGAEWSGMPEFDQQDKTAFRSIVVHFKDQLSVDQFAKLVKKTITDKTKYLWFPEKEIERYMDKRYKAKA